MKVKDFLSVCGNYYLSIEVFDEFSLKMERFETSQGAISRYGNYKVISWELLEGTISINIRTQF